MGLFYTKQTKETKKIVVRPRRTERIRTLPPSFSLLWDRNAVFTRQEHAGTPLLPPKGSVPGW